MNFCLYYIHDPMCSWCWGFKSVWRKIKSQLPGTLPIQYILGGLAPNSDQLMPTHKQQCLQQTWKKIQQHVPGTEFNFEFWNQCKPRRSTYPACRAVLAAKQQGDHFEELMITGVQEAYYLCALNPSDIEILIEIAKGIGLYQQTFVSAIRSAELEQRFQHELNFCQRIFAVSGAAGFPSLVLQVNEKYIVVRKDYNEPKVVLNFIARCLNH